MIESKHFAILIIFSISMVFVFSYIHELTHYQIATYAGCKDVNIVFDFLDVNRTIVDSLNGINVPFMSTHQDSNCKISEAQFLAQSENEIIGYNVMPILEVISILLFFGFMGIMNKKNTVINLRKKKKSINIVEKPKG